MRRHCGLFLVALALSGVIAEHALGETRHAETQAIGKLVGELNAWIKTNTDLTPRPLPPENVNFVEPGELVIADGQEHWIRQRNRGLYDPSRAIVYLTRPWDPDDRYDQSVLLHELIHHAQVDARHWYCPQAMEWDAYQLQENWLAAHNVASRFNWTAILLESSCAARDHHPD